MIVTCVYIDVVVLCLMKRRPPRSTRTDTLFPYTTLCRSLEICRSALVIEIGKLSVSDFLEVSVPGDTIGPMVIISTFTTTGRCPTKPLFCGCRLSLLTGHNRADHGQGFRCVAPGYGVQTHLLGSLVVAPGEN